MLPRMAQESREKTGSDVELALRKLALEIERKDPATSSHLLRVADWSEEIARCMGLSDLEVQEARLAGILHDIGKLWIKSGVLLKQDSLNEEEWRHMREHPVLGWRSLSHFLCLNRVSKGLLLHHERWDGKGYPFGISGENIPLLARIVAVADAFDAMISTRPYRKALSPQKALEEIRRGRH